jgi:hypothetical protein
VNLVNQMHAGLPAARGQRIPVVSRGQLERDRSEVQACLLFNFYCSMSACHLSVKCVHERRQLSMMARLEYKFR